MTRGRVGMHNFLITAYLHFESGASVDVSKIFFWFLYRTSSVFPADGLIKLAIGDKWKLDQMRLEKPPRFGNTTKTYSTKAKFPMILTPAFLLLLIVSVFERMSETAPVFGANFLEKLLTLSKWKITFVAFSSSFPLGPIKNTSVSHSFPQSLLVQGKKKNHNNNNTGRVS